MTDNLSPDLLPDELEWKEPPTSVRHVVSTRSNEIIRMRKALFARPGKWVLLQEFDNKRAAAHTAGNLRKVQDSRFAGLEFRGQVSGDGEGSELYVRAKKPEPQ